MLRNSEFVGWLMFIASACAFVASSIRSGDPFGLIGSLLFLIACFVFLIPIVRPDDSIRR